MKKLYSAVLLMHIGTICLSQNTHIGYDYAIKAYNTTSFTIINTYDPSLTLYSSRRRKTVETEFIKPTVAIQFKNWNDNFHELEFLNLQLFHKSTVYEDIIDSSGAIQVLEKYKLTTTKSSIRYEFIIPFAKRKDRRIVPAFGFGITPSFYHQNYSPKLANQFHSTTQSYEVQVFISNRLLYYFSKKFFLDINIPISFNLVRTYMTKTDNPSLSKTQRKYTKTTVFDNDPYYYSFRIGLGVKL